MRHCFLFMLLMVAIKVGAQGKYCRTYEDFVAGRWNDAPSLHIDYAIPHQFWAGSCGYKITSDDKATSKLLMKDAFIVEYHDSLFVNLRSLRYKKYKFGVGYVKAIRTVNNILAFMEKDVRNRMRSFVMGQLFGVIGTVISEQSSQKTKVCYIIDNGGDGKKIAVKRLDDSVYKEALLESEQIDIQHDNMDSP